MPCIESLPSSSLWNPIHNSWNPQVIEGPFRGSVVNCVPSGAGPCPKQPQAKKKSGREGPAGVLALDGPLPPELLQVKRADRLRSGSRIGCMERGAVRH